MHCPEAKNGAQLYYMNILIAPNTFKGTLSATEAADVIERGVRRVLPDAITKKIPMADGGDGTMEALVTSAEGTYRETEVLDPLGRKRRALFGLIDDGTTAVVEMAQASGLLFLSEAERNPLITSTYGTGQLINAALDTGARRIIIGIGGSATNDGGAGMAEALGIEFLNAEGKQLPRGGGFLNELAHIKLETLDPRISLTKILVASDVTNPLTGINGASTVYGPQKGATPQMIDTLDGNLAHYAAIIMQDIGKDILTVPGGGAAGGLGAGLIAFLNAQLVSGFDLVSKTVRLVEHMREVDYVITGEGRIDSQTIEGKVPIGVARIAKNHGIPVLAIGGSIDGDLEVLRKEGITSFASMVSSEVSLHQAMEHAKDVLSDVTMRAVRKIEVK